MGFCDRWRALPKPTIAQVQGKVIAGGLMLVWPCDLVVASRSAKFGLPEIKHGLLAAFGGVFRSPRALPLNVAKHMILTGDPISAEQAAHFGLVNVLCDPERALEGALADLQREVRGRLLESPRTRQHCLAWLQRASPLSGWRLPLADQPDLQLALVAVATAVLP